MFNVEIRQLLSTDFSGVSALLLVAEILTGNFNLRVEKRLARGDVDADRRHDHF